MPPISKTGGSTSSTRPSPRRPLPGNFVDPHLPDRYAPFNVQNLGGKLYVTYARQDRDGGLSNGGTGFVSVFDLNGNFIRRLVSRGHLDAPWGLSLAPAGFGQFGGALLVGNHGDGRIHAFNPDTGRFLGRLEDERGPGDPDRRAVRPGVRQRRIGRRHERPVLRGRPGRRDGRPVRIAAVRRRDSTGRTGSRASSPAGACSPVHDGRRPTPRPPRRPLHRPAAADARPAAGGDAGRRRWSSPGSRAWADPIDIDFGGVFVDGSGAGGEPTAAGSGRACARPGRRFTISSLERRRPPD